MTAKQTIGPGTDLTASPIWLLLAPGGDTQDGDDGEMPCLLVDGDESWRSTLSDQIAVLPSGRRFIVAYDRRWARTVLGLLSHRRWRREAAPPSQQIERAIESSGGVIQERYWVWPSARVPRLVYPVSDRTTLKWFQRSGVLGGGGRRLWTRVLARSPLFTPLGGLLTPGAALVVKKAAPARGRP